MDRFSPIEGTRFGYERESNELPCTEITVMDHFKWKDDQMHLQNYPPKLPDYPHTHSFH